MVCIYCNGPTQVTNSRLQRRANQVWRRRACASCNNTFTTHEKADLETSLVIQYSAKDIRPFLRETLFVSVYESCKHRKQPIQDTIGLTQTIIDHVRADIVRGTVTRDVVTQRALEALQRFDTTAAALYAAYHPRTLQTPVKEQ